MEFFMKTVEMWFYPKIMDDEANRKMSTHFYVTIDVTFFH